MSDKPEPDVRLTAWVHGFVQGVGFRWWTRCRALEQGLTGYAANQADGRVLVQMLERHGVTRLDPKGQRFDPNQHQAVMEMDRPDLPAGSIAEVFQSQLGVPTRYTGVGLAVLTWLVVIGGISAIVLAEALVLGAKAGLEPATLLEALRQTPIALWSWMFYLPLAVLGIPPLVFVVVALVDLLYQYWVHTELIGRLGWADRVFVTPSNHRVHHGQNAYCIDRNYGGILILWDRLFGTFAEERMEEPVVYGVRKAVARWEPLAAVFRVYGWLLRRLRETPGWRNRLAILFRWSAADPEWARREALISGSLARFRRFSTGTPAAIRIYGGFQFALGTLLIVHFLAVFPGLEAGGAAAYALVIAGWTWSVGRLLEGARGARAALVKGVSMGLFGVWVIAMAVANVLAGGTPHAVTMGAVGFVALVANVGVAVMLYRYRDGDANMRSVWLCTRNDALGNVAVMLAALGVFGTGSLWPDIAVAAVMASLALSAASQTIASAVAKEDTLRVHEIYASIQGESTFAGLPCAFVRLTGCNLRCVWCDTPHAFYEGTRMTRAEVRQKALALGTPLVELTGGEPLLQPGAFPLMAELADAGRERESSEGVKKDSPFAMESLYFRSFNRPLLRRDEEIALAKKIEAAEFAYRDAVLGLPMVATYTGIVYWVFRGKVRLGENSY